MAEEQELGGNAQNHSPMKRGADKTVIHPDFTLMDALLEKIEKLEVHSLVWGFVDGSLSRSEAIRMASDIIRDHRLSMQPENLLEDLIEACLLYEFQGSDGTRRLRSRFAETVRLLSHLRQLFPKRSWSTAPRLVSDFRVDVRPRRFPDRNVEPTQALKELSAEANLTTSEVDLYNALLYPGGKPLSLARFQVESTRFVLKKHGYDRGVIVTAGTGSGKTLCFYLPGLIQIGIKVEKGQFWTKALAIYPRTELLKDQFSEAYRLARRLDPLLLSHGSRPVMISALFSSTPNESTREALEDKRWSKKGTGYVCPFIVCPNCGAEMIWRAQDVDNKRERLLCTRSGQCSGSIEEDTIILTRERAIKGPADVLFTTTEMLNRRMSDTRMRRLFGLGMPSGKRPRLILLDEVHTYTGTSGAHAALVFRRWRHALKSTVTAVGLSATLREADRFFSDLTGLPSERVVEISPKEEDMISASADYQIILRGDPVSQASLLSTTIQTSMLLGRLMDLPGEGRSGGRYGHRIFVFSDDLDVINRLYDDLRDAEGYDIFGNRKPGRLPLAALRRHRNQDAIQFDLDGQRWKICEDIGRELDSPLRVSRTTSQDAGVVSGSDIVVATAALEVGYDDPGVGAVVQHKAPRSMAAYVQRKGRAGRSRFMRPFMVTVLSDYGRDRLAYQAYEQLFDPVLPPQQLPVRNQYILRMQAAFALIDWLADRKAHTVPNGWFWHSLSAPAKPDQKGILQRQEYACELLGNVLKGDDQELLHELHAHLSGALGITDDEVQSILWEPPRSLMLEVIPTLVRRLYRKWELCSPVPGGMRHEYFMPSLPLPEFLPASLFNELSLPEVKVIVPPATSRHEEKVEALPLIQAMNQLAPGRVIRRFAPERGALCHWIPVSDESSEQTLRISGYAEETEFVGHFPVMLEGEEVKVPVYRPWTIRLQKVKGKEILPTSNASLIWSSGFQLHGEPVMVAPPIRTGWSEIVQSIECYLHSFGSAVSVRRFALSAAANIRRLGSESNVTVTFVDEGDGRAGIGFEQEVDGIVVRYRLPSAEELNRRALSPDLKASSRSAFFRYRVLSDASFPVDANLFQRDWLQQIYLSAILSTACRFELSLERACGVLSSTDPMPVFKEVMDSIFSIQEVRQAVTEEEGEDDEEGSGSSFVNGQKRQTCYSSQSDSAKERVGRLQQKLTGLFSQPVVVERLHQLASNLWSPEPHAWGEWLRHKLHETLGHAVLSACLQRAPEHVGFDTLLMDPGALNRDSSETAELHVTENTLGGAGVIQALTKLFSEEPRALFSAIEAALAPADFELATIELKRFLIQVCSDNRLAELVSKIRETFDHRDREGYRKDLYRLLAERGVHIGHVASVVLNARLLRPGMDTGAYRLLLELLDYWDQLEASFEVGIDHRVFCYLAATSKDFAQGLRQMVRASDDAKVSDVVAILYGVIWPKASEIRQRRLESYHPFRRTQLTDPLLVHQLLLVDQIASVSIDADDWVERLQEGLAVFGSCRLTAPVERESELHDAIVRLIAMPIDVEFLQLFPTVERFEQTDRFVSVVFTLREAV